MTEKMSKRFCLELQYILASQLGSMDLILNSNRRTYSIKTSAIDVLFAPGHVDNVLIMDVFNSHKI